MRNAFMLLAAVSATALGCGSKGDNPTDLVPVKGRVVTASGKTLGWVDVQFVPTEAGSTTAYGSAGADGTFSLKSLNDQDGARPGKYKVTVKPRQAKGATPPTLPAKLAEEHTTTLTAEVPSGGGEVTVTLP